MDRDGIQSSYHLSITLISWNYETNKTSPKRNEKGDSWAWNEFGSSVTQFWTLNKRGSKRLWLEALMQASIRNTGENSEWKRSDVKGAEANKKGKKETMKQFISGVKKHRRRNEEGCRRRSNELPITAKIWSMTCLCSADVSFFKRRADERWLIHCN